MPHVYEFGDFSLEPDRRVLRRAGEQVVLAPKVFDTLLALVESKGRIVTRDELLDRVWAGAVVEEGGLSRNISILRKALGERREEHHYVVTIPGRGYRFAAEVRQAERHADDAVTAPAPEMERESGRTTSRIATRTQLIAIMGIVGAAVAVGYFLTRRTESSTATAQHLLSTFPGSHRTPTLSPDGTRLAFVDVVSGSIPQVWITSLADGQARPLTFDSEVAHRPRWSPMGDQIVYTRISRATSGQAQTSIWSVAPDGGTPRKLIDHGRNASWSDDGRSLVFERASDIWTADAAGSNQRRVEGVPHTDLLLSDRTPAFSVDGSHIAFFHPERGPMGDVWIVATAGGQARRLTFGVARGGGLTWTPDGRSVVFASRHAGSMTLWKVPAEGGKPEPVLVGAGEDTDPVFSRDGHALVYTNTRTSLAVVVQALTGGRERELLESRTDVAFPTFSPQSDRIAFFQVTGDGDAHVFTISTEGGDLTRVTRGQQHNSLPQWSADGAAIYYYQERPPHTSFRKISLRSGEDEELVRGWTWQTQNGARVDPSGRRIIYSKLDREAVVATLIRDIGSGNERAFATPLRNPRWSPDGQYVVGVDASEAKPPLGHVTLCAVDGARCRRITRGSIPQWSTDGARLYFLRPAESADDRELWSISISGKEETKLAVLRSFSPLDSYDVSATGEVVWVQYRHGRSEVWLTDFR